MNEIEVGDYIRDKEGNITKILNLLNLDRDVYLYLGEDGYQYSDNSIKTHSKNKIELLEVGDIIKYKELRAVTNQWGTHFYEDYIIEIHNDEELKNIKEEIENKGIRLISLLTKEAFKEREYVF